MACFASACLVVGISTGAHAAIIVEDIKISSTSLIRDTPASPSVITLVDDPGIEGSAGRNTVSSGVQHDAPRFAPLRTTGFQATNGINRVEVDAPIMGLFNEVQEVRSRTLWTVQLKNPIGLFTPNVPLDPALEFYLFGGALEFDCYNCFLKTTELTLIADLHIVDRFVTQSNIPLWRYSARLSSNGFSAPTFDTSASLDPQGIGLPDAIVTSAPAFPSYRVDIQPFAASLDLGTMLPGAGMVIEYEMSVVATGDIGLEGAMRAWMGDPFAVNGGTGPEWLIDGRTMAALMAPVPEPAPWLAMLCGLGCVGAAVGRLRSRQAPATMGAN